MIILRRETVSFRGGLFGWMDSAGPEILFVTYFYHIARLPTCC